MTQSSFYPEDGFVKGISDILGPDFGEDTVGMMGNESSFYSIMQAPCFSLLSSGGQLVWCPPVCKSYNRTQTPY